MPFKVQHLAQESKLSHELRLPLLERYYPREVVGELLSQCHAWETRERKLSQLLICWPTAIFSHSPGSPRASNAEPRFSAAWRRAS